MIFHRHTWEVVEKFEQPAAAELLKGKGTLSTGAFDDPLRYLMRPVIVTYSCAGCLAQKVVRV